MGPCGRYRHRVELVVDRLTVRGRDRGRLNEAVERALELSSGEIIIASPDDDEEDRLSRRYSCPSCGQGFEPLVPQSFSFNHQEGMCPVCDGLGTGEGIDRDLLVPDRRLSIREGGIAVWGPVEGEFGDLLAVAGLRSIRPVGTRPVCPATRACGRRCRAW
mgnify:CR=1 FL=1